jgi:signal transduction histidine kinase
MRMRNNMPDMRGRIPYMAFKIYDKNGKIIHSEPPFFDQKEYIKINENRVMNEEKNKYLNLYIKRNRIYSKREKDFLKILFIYSSILLIFLIGIFFYIANKFSNNILNFFMKMKEKFFCIAKGNYDIKIENKYEEFEPFKSGVEDMASLLKKEEERRKDFITNISHDIKTPISIIKANIEGILDDVLKDSKENMKLILQEVDKLENFIKRIKYFDLTEKKEKEWINIKKDLKKYKEKYKNLMEIRLSMSQNFVVKFNRNDFETIFDNLLSNAYKYNEKQAKKCMIKIQKQENRLIIRVIDNGKGIKEENKKLIFEKFYKQDKSRTDRHSMGLGLAIVKKIVNQYEGYIDVKSKEGFYTAIKIVLRNLDYK